MVVLADEVLESFFETDLSESFKLSEVPDLELPLNSGFLGDIWSSIATDSNKKIFNKFSDELGKTIGKHQVLHKPSIGRYTKLEEPKARESLLTPTLRKTLSKPNLATPSSPSQAVPGLTSGLTIDPTLEPTKPLPGIPDSANLTAMPLLKAVNAAAIMERTPFAIDDAKDDESDYDDDLTSLGADDDQVLDEVRFISCSPWQS